MNNSMNTKNKFDKHIQLSYWLCPIVIHCCSMVHMITRYTVNVIFRLLTRFIFDQSNFLQITKLFCLFEAPVFFVLSIYMYNIGGSWICSRHPKWAFRFSRLRSVLPVSEAAVQEQWLKGCCSGSRDASSFNLNLKALYQFKALARALTLHRISIGITTQRTLSPHKLLMQLSVPPWLCHLWWAFCRKQKDTL